MVPQKIYRFMSFESFVNIVQKKALAFVHHDKWEDPYEGFIFKSIKHEEGRKEILRILKELTPDHAKKHFARLLKFEKTLFGQSWTKLPESDALWRIYSYNNMSIRVEIYSGSVIGILQGTLPVTPYEIKYSDSISIKSQLEKIVDGNKIIPTNVLLTKRTAFKHEEEVRLLFFDSENIPNDQQKFPPEVLKELYKTGDITKQEFDNGMKEITKEEKIPDVKYIEYEHNKKFICSVMLHPLAPNWFNETLAAFCENNNLKYLGKSKLYEFNYEGPQSST